MKKNVTFFICFTLIFLIPSITSSQEVKLVYDIKKGNQGSHPLSPVVFNGKLYFSAYQSKSRDKMELYVYDGFSSPRQIDNIILPDPPFYTNKIIFKQKLYFVAYDKDHGYELWVYDGLNPPSMVADTNPNQTKWGSSGSSPEEFTLFKGKLYFSAVDGIHGRELFVYDGFNPPTMVENINPDNGGLNTLYSSYLTVYNNKLYFCANDGTHGDELWEYDGLNPPSMVTNLDPGKNGSYPSLLIAFKGKLYFKADQGANSNRSMWEYNGAGLPQKAGIFLPAPISVSANSVAELNGKLYYEACNDIHGLELWSFDGSNSPTMVADINSGANSSYAGRDIFIFNNKLYFNANDGTHGRELWVFDGLNPPSMVADIIPGEGSSMSGPLIGYNGQLYLSTYHDLYGYELWKYDEINPPTLAADINKYGKSSYPNKFFEYGQSLYFIANFYELFKFDGIQMPHKIEKLDIQGYYLSPLALFKNKLYFISYDGTHGQELWSYDWSSPPTMLADINPGYFGSMTNYTPFYITEYNEKIYFNAYSDGYCDVYDEYTDYMPTDNELWAYDGIQNPQRVADICSGDCSSFPSHLTAFQNNLYFLTTGDLWIYNGDTPPSKVADLPSAKYLQEVNNKLYIITNEELWRYDGLHTPEKVADISPLSGFVLFKGKIYFVGSDEDHGDELWFYDGINPPVMMEDIRPGEDGSLDWYYPGFFKEPWPFYVFNGNLYFRANDGVHGDELWCYDGTHSPRIVKDIHPGKYGSNPENFTVFQNRLYFSAEDDKHGVELWVLLDMIENPMDILLQVFRKTDKAWIIQKQYGEINVDIEKFTDISVAKYRIYRKKSTGNYQSVGGFSESNLQDGSYTFYDKYLEKNKTYTYKVEAKDANGKIIAVSNEVIVE